MWCVFIKYTLKNKRPSRKNMPCMLVNKWLTLLERQYTLFILLKFVKYKSFYNFGLIMFYSLFLNFALYAEILHYGEIKFYFLKQRNRNSCEINSAQKNKKQKKTFINMCFTASFNNWNFFCTLGRVFNFYE